MSSFPISNSQPNTSFNRTSVLLARAIGRLTIVEDKREQIYFLIEIENCFL